jgi:hypothetical protein
MLQRGEGFVNWIGELVVARSSGQEGKAIELRSKGFFRTRQSVCLFPPPTHFGKMRALSEKIQTQPTHAIASICRVSVTGKVHQLLTQGQRVSQVAFSLRLTVEAVNGYLGITSKSS